MNNKYILCSILKYLKIVFLFFCFRFINISLDTLYRVVSVVIVVIHSYKFFDFVTRELNIINL